MRSPTATRPRVLPLVLATMAAQSQLVVLAPTIVAAGREFGTSVGTVGQARAIAAASAVVAALLIARLIDRVGLRRLMAAGACLALSASAAIATAPSLGVFLAAHCVSGVAFACLLSSGLAGVGAFPRERSARAMGFVIAANALAWIVAGPLGGVLTDARSWRAAHLVPAALALVALAAARRATPLPTAPRTGLSGVLSDPRARRWLVAELAAWFVWAGELTYGAAFLIQHHDVPGSVAGAAFAVAAAAFFCGSVRSARLIRRFPRRRLIGSATLAMGALIPLQFCLAPSFWVTLGFLSATALCGGVRTSASAGLGLAQMPGRPGAIMTAQTAVTQLGYLTAALVGAGLLGSAGYAALGITLGGGALVSAALFTRVADPERATLGQRRHNGLRPVFAHGTA